MSKNVLILESSPRRKGNTAVLAARAAQAIREDGINVDLIRLHGMDIAPCNHCDGCVRKGQYCMLQDDMQLIYPKVVAADGLILASLIYWFNINAQLKVCMDRWYGVWQNQRELFKGKPVGSIFVYGDIDLYTSGGINALYTLESTIRYLSALPIGFVYGTTNEIGDAQKDAQLMEKAWQLGKKTAEFLLNGKS